jgi:hypothetical protein
MKNPTKTKLVLSVLGLLLVSGQAMADSFPFHGHNDSGRERVQNTPELQAIHDSMLRPITPGHLMRNAAFDGIGGPIRIQNTPELQAVHDSMQHPFHLGHIGANSAFDERSRWVNPVQKSKLS